MHARLPTHAKGFTLVELLVVIAIILILIGVSIEGFLSFSTQPRSDAAAQTVLAALREAQARTLASDQGQQYGVHIDTSSVVVFTGDTYTAGAPTNDVRSFTRAEVSALSLSGGATDIVFSPLRGEASATGTITVADRSDASNTRTITVYATGLSEVQ